MLIKGTQERSVIYFFYAHVRQLKFVVPKNGKIGGIESTCREERERERESLRVSCRATST